MRHQVGFGEIFAVLAEAFSFGHKVASRDVAHFHEVDKRAFSPIYDVFFRFVSFFGLFN